MQDTSTCDSEFYPKAQVLVGEFIVATNGYDYLDSRERLRVANDNMKQCSDLSDPEIVIAEVLQ